MDSNTPREDHDDYHRWAEQAAADEAAEQMYRQICADEDQERAGALRQAALYALQHYPGEQGRIGKGLTIALNGSVRQGAAFGNAMVQSETNPEVIYQISGRHCDCPDQAAPGGRCKHRFAYYLIRLAQASLAMQDDQEDSHAEAKPPWQRPNHWSSPNGCHEDCPVCREEREAELRRREP